jgi:hypothetical protein
MTDFLFYVFIFGLLALAAVAVAWVIKSYMSGTSPAAAIFGPRPEKRLAVIEQASVDGRRRLILIRRDGIEHLIMTGGPVDVVIETGIGERRGRPEVEAPVSPPVYARPARNLGQIQPDRAAE